MLKAFITICLTLFITGTKAQIITHNISDDGYARVPLQFPFPYYGQVFTESYMFSNGVIGFLNPQNSWCCSGFDLRTTQGSPFNFAIMPLQTDLLNYGQGRFLTEGTPQYQRYMWENISEYGAPNNLNTFGVEIRPSGSISMLYEKVNISAGRQVTIGMTGDTSQGQFEQYYHGAGFVRENFTYGVAATIDLCVSNPLSNPTCAGYQEAYFNQQCNIDALYNSACPMYAEAYHDLQCTISPLYAPDCDGYPQAYFNQQCSINALYAETCTGYAQAFFNQQCNLNPLYDRTCTGYSEAYALANVVPSAQAITVNAPQIVVNLSGQVALTTPIIADSIVNEVVTKKPEPPKPVTPAPEPQKKEEPKAVAVEKPKPKEPPKNDTAKGAPEIVASVQIKQSEVPQILDLSYGKLLSKNTAIQDNARVNRLMNYRQDLLHKELKDEQWRR